MTHTQLLDTQFIDKVKQLALPMIIQGLAMSTLNFLDVFMVGKLGEVQVAAVGVATQHYNIFNVTSFNLAGGAGIFVAQFWGARDVDSLRKFQGIAFISNMILALIFVISSLITPDGVIALYSQDGEVISEGIKYLVMLTPAFIFQAISVSYMQALRSTENVKLPLFATLVGISLNTALNYCLIFGEFGFPQMGVEGAALATVIARFVEAAIMSIATYIRKLPPTMTLGDILAIKLQDITKFFKIVGPVIIHSIAWVVGTSIYTMIYGRINTESLAAFNIVGSMERISIMLFSSLATACSIMISNKIGAGDEKGATEDAKKYIALMIIAFLLCAFIFALLCPLLLNFYNLSDTTIDYARYLLYVLAGITITKASNILLNVGILRGGGDTKFSMITDILGVWLIGIPLAWLSVFVFGWDIHLVVLLVSVEEVFKLTAGFLRFKSGKWINNLVHEKTPIHE